MVTVLNWMPIQNTLLCDHNVYFYASPKEKNNVLFSNLKAGLDKGCSALYIASGENIEQVQVEMRKFGLELDDPMKLRIVTSRQFYIPNGAFHAYRVVEQFRSMVDESMDRGFEGLYVSGDAADTFDYFTKNGMTEAWFAYEKAFGRTFKFPIEAICAYSTDQIKLNAPAFLQLIQAHKNTVTTRDLNFVDNEKICMDAITGELYSILGEGATELIFSYLEKRLKIPRNIILARIGDFNQSLESILGNGAATLEKQILNKLHAKIEL